jgi:hypothetical protein
VGLWQSISFHIIGISSAVYPVFDSFPFIGAPRFTCQELLTPSLWCRLFGFADKIDHTTLPEPIQQFLFLGEGGNDRTKKNISSIKKTGACTTAHR